MSIRPAGRRGRLRTESAIRICYLGNSITAQRDSYAHALHPLLVDRWGADERLIRGGLGGVGSLACAGLLDYLILRHDPDICFVECSLADAQGATARELVAVALTSIIEDLQERGIIPILLHMPRFDETRIDPSVVDETYRRIAEEYGVLSIDVRNAGSPEDYPDGVHPTPAGSEVIALAINGALPADPPDAPSPTASLVGDRIRFLPPAPEGLAPDRWEWKRFKFTLPYLRLAPPAGIVLEDAHGQVLGVYVVADDDSGVVRVTSDAAMDLIQVWDRWCAVPRIQFISVHDATTVGGSITVAATALETGSRNAQGLASTDMHAGSLAIMGAAVRRPRRITGDGEPIGAWWLR